MAALSISIRLPSPLSRTGAQRILKLSVRRSELAEIPSRVSSVFISRSCSEASWPQAALARLAFYVTTALATSPQRSIEDGSRA